jgi:hypothetical protein
MEERWFHIIENHDDLAGHDDDVLSAIEDPDFVIEGYAKEICSDGVGPKQVLESMGHPFNKLVF